MPSAREGIVVPGGEVGLDRDRVVVVPVAQVAPLAGFVHVLRRPTITISVRCHRRRITRPIWLARLEQVATCGAVAIRRRSAAKLV